MREAPVLPGAAPALGPLACAPEQELADAYAELRETALPMAWAAVALGVDVARLKALARRGELVAIPGPWAMRQSYASGTGYFLPAWQFAAGARTIEPELSEVLEVAAAAGWTGLDLHRYMTTPTDPSGATPAKLLHADGAGGVVALIRGEPAEEGPATAPHRRLRLSRLEPLATRRRAARGAAGARRGGRGRGPRIPSRAATARRRGHHTEQGR